LAKLYGVPLEKGIPALAILSAGGDVLYATHEGELEDARHMGDQGIHDFFQRVIDSTVAKK
jgi:protein disulfide-isomerase